MPDAATTSVPPLQQALVALATRQSLSESLAAAVFAVVMRGEASPVQIAALLVGLRVKGETAEEVAGAARALREAMVRVDADGGHLVDTCGTGGGSVTTFNISTAAAFVAAGAGAAVAKHGNRSFTSRCGSADVLEEVVGVADRDRAPLLAAALARLGAEHALVVHGRVGMDEISPTGVTDVWEVQGGAVRTWEVDPGDYGLAVPDPAALCGGDPPANASRMRRILERDGDDAPGLAAVLLNAGAAVYVAGLARTYADGVAKARAAVESGAAREALERLRRASPSTSE